MKAVIVSIIARLFVILAVLGFVLGVVAITDNTKFLWLLFLLLIVEAIPTYTYKKVPENINYKITQSDD